MAVLATLLFLAGCAEEPPIEPPLNKAGDQVKRAATAAVTGERALIHQWIPVDASISAGGVDVKLSEFVFNPPITSSTEAATITIPQSAIRNPKSP